MPAEGQTYVSRPLSDLSLAYHNSMSVRHGPFPVKYVTKKKGSVYILRPENLRRVNTGPRSYLEPAERSHWVPNPHPFELDRHSLYDLIDDDHAEFDMDEVLDPSAAMTMTMTGQLEVSAERDARDKCFVASVFDSDWTETPSPKWDAAMGNPIGDFNEAAYQVLLGCGMRANAVLIAGNVWNELISLEQIVDRFKHTTAGDITPEQFASLFSWLDPANVFIGDMVEDSGAETQETSQSADVSLGNIWTDNVLVFRRNEMQMNAQNQEALQIGFGRSFEYKRNRFVRRYRVENPSAQAIYVGMDYDNNVTENGAGFLFTNPIDLSN